MTSRYIGPRYVLGVDPGKTTGVALVDADLRTIETWELQFEELGIIEQHIETRRYSDEKLAVAIEQFLITMNTAKNTQAPWSLEVIGLVRWWTLNAVPFIMQQPASAKSFMTNHRLQQMGWYTRGKGHANDAARHAGLFLVQRGWWDDRLGTIDQ